MRAAGDDRISHQQLRELLDYCPNTGDFTWKVSRGRVRAGQKAGTFDAYGYVNIIVFRRVYKAHRLAWFYVNGGWPSLEIDHINGARADNRIANLREATSAQNKWNQHRLRAQKTSAFVGVSWLALRKKWRAVIGVAGQTKHLGLFSSERDAHAAYIQAKQQYHVGAAA